MVTQTNLQHLEERLDGFRSQTPEFSDVPRAFIYHFGPYICMAEGYEEVADKMSQRNSIMNVFRCAAFLIRSIKAGKTYKDSKVFIRDFLIEVDTQFSDEVHRSAREALSKLAVDYMKCLRSEQKRRNATESIMTNYAPIVTYDQSLEKPEFDPEESEIVQESINPNMIERMDAYLKPNSDALESELDALIYHNLLDIMCNYQLVIQWNYSLKSLHQWYVHTLRNPKEHATARDYYLLSAVYYHFGNVRMIRPQMDFYEKFQSPMDYVEFESTIGQIIRDSILAPDEDISALESWLDSALDKHEEAAVQTLLDAHSANPEAGEVFRAGAYDLNLIYNYIAIHQHLRFDRWSKRVLTSTLDELKIVNVNFLKPNVQAFELSNEKIIVPFTDMTDWEVKFIVLEPYATDVYVVKSIE